MRGGRGVGNADEDALGFAVGAGEVESVEGVAGVWGGEYGGVGATGDVGWGGRCWGGLSGLGVGGRGGVVQWFSVGRCFEREGDFSGKRQPENRIGIFRLPLG